MAASENVSAQDLGNPPQAQAHALITTSTREAARALAMSPKDAARLQQLDDREALGLSPALTDKQIAEILGVCPRTVFALRQKELPYFLVGNRPRVRREDLDAYMSRLVVKGGAQ